MMPHFALSAAQAAEGQLGFDALQIFADLLQRAPAVQLHEDCAYLRPHYREVGKPRRQCRRGVYYEGGALPPSDKEVFYA